MPSFQTLPFLFFPLHWEPYNVDGATISCSILTFATMNRPLLLFYKQHKPTLPLYFSLTQLLSHFLSYLVPCLNNWSQLLASRHFLSFWVLHFILFILFMLNLNLLLSQTFPNLDINLRSFYAESATRTESSTKNLSS